MNESKYEIVSPVPSLHNASLNFSYLVDPWRTSLKFIYSLLRIFWHVEGEIEWFDVYERADFYAYQFFSGFSEGWFVLYIIVPPFWLTRLLIFVEHICARSS